MTLRSHPSFPRHCVEELKSRVCLSPTVTTDMLLAESVLDLRDLLGSGAERATEDSCTEDALLPSLTADVDRVDQSKCPRQEGERREVLIIEDDVKARFRESSLSDSPRREEVPTAHALDAYFADRDLHKTIAPEERLPLPFPVYDAERTTILTHSETPSPDFLHDAVLEDIFAEGSVLSSALVDGYLQRENAEQKEPWSPLRERLRLWEEVPSKEEPKMENKADATNEKAQSEVPDNPPQEDSPPMREDVPRLQAAPMDEQPEGASIESAEPSANTKPSTSSSSILSRGIGGVRSLASRAWGGLRRLIAA